MTNEELRASVSNPWDEFRNHPGQVAHLKWDLLRDFYQDVVKVNGIQLITLSELPQVDKKARKKLFREAMNGQESAYTGEITRLLYNYLVSTATLVDHCRHVMKSYDGTDFYTEYTRRVADLAHLPEFAFLKDLRNYFAHHKIPSIGLSIGNIETGDDNFRHEALIYTSDLDDSTKWSSLSKGYIEDNFPYVYISGVIKIHLEKLSELYSWIFPRFFDLHSEEYEESLTIKRR